MTTYEFFYDQCRVDADYFDEGRTSFLRNVDSSTGSINTSEIDPYRQGVEITQLKHFDAGMVKIHAGEPGHYLRKNRFGMGDRRWKSARFDDRTHFDVSVLSGSSINGVVQSTIASDDGEIIDTTIDGSVEPLTLRYVTRLPTSYGSVHVPRGAMMAGNVDANDGSDDVVHVYDDSERSTLGFFDVGSQFERDSMFIDVTVKEPFVEKNVVCNFILSGNTLLSSTIGNDMVAALVPMTGSTDNHVAPWERSATCGWTYDYNTSVGTDSLAFGGMTY